MGPTRRAAALRQRATGVALLVDTVDAASAAMALLDEPDLAADWVWARLRLAELVRRVAPDDALDRLEGVEDREADRIRCHALLDLMRFEEARQVAARIAWSPAARDEIVRARLDYLTSRDRALSRLDAVIADDSTPAEERAEALNLRARWRAEAGDFGGGADDFEALEQLASQYLAVATRGLARLYRGLYRRMQSTGAAPEGARSLVAAVIEALTREVDCDVDKLGPIPAHVHALLVHLGGENRQPDAFLMAVYQLAGLMETAGMIEDAYATLLYSGKLARRLFASEVSAPIASRLELLLERVGPERAERLRDREEERAAEFLAARRTADEV